MSDTQNHATYAEVTHPMRRETLPNGVEVAVIRLVAGETAWNPVSTKDHLAGPARLDYFFHPDGGVTVQVSELDRAL